MTAARDLASTHATGLFVDGRWHTINNVFERDGLIAVLVDDITDSGFWFEPDHEIPTR